jgi:hypothetical protein
MLTRNAKASAGRSRATGMVAALVLIGWSAAASAQVQVNVAASDLTGGYLVLPKAIVQTTGEGQVNVAASDLTGGYVVLPKVIVHTTGGTPPVLPGGIATDTIVQLSSTNEAEPIKVNCWWVDANSHCGICDPSIQDCVICNSNADCAAFPGLNCVQDWRVRDFSVTLTSGQPIGFLASQGLKPVPCDPALDQNCGGGEAAGSVAQVQEDPFRGELKCVQVDADDDPVLRSDLKAEATIVRTTVPGMGPVPVTTAAGYNAIGFGTVSLGTEDNADPLCLGSLPTGSDDACAATYAPCPGVLILNHFFEGAAPEIGGIVNTDLTLVPCSEDLGNPTVSANFEIVAQMLIYNEFEQRFSSSTRVECYRATTLSDIDTPAGPSGDKFSIFSVGVEGTITGQTRIRGVQQSGGNLGYGLLGVACENYRELPGGPILATTAFNLHHSAFRLQGDAVYRTISP